MILYYITLLVLTEVVSAEELSPCPEIFSYERNESNKWYGTIFVRTKANLSEVQLNITIDKPAESIGVLGNWLGQDLQNNTVFVIRNQQLQDGFYPLIRFFVRFNPSESIPSVKTIKLNGDTICPTKKTDSNANKTVYIRATTTDGSEIEKDNNHNNNDSVAQKQELKISAILSTVTNSSDNLNKQKSNAPTSTVHTLSSASLEVDETDYPDSDFPFSDFTWHILDPKEIKPLAPNCGTVAPRAIPLLSNGEDTWPGQWPWHAALYGAYVNSYQRSLVYICGGTLISEQHVILPAHYVYSNKGLHPNDFLISLGKYNLSGYGPHIQDRSVVEIIIHPEYDNSTYLNDIAILKLSRPVTITNFVRPCCLWEGDSGINSLLDKKGIVVGWDDKNRKLMQAEIPIVETDNCLPSQSVSNTNYCAGFKNGTSVCTGKSIGGMFFPREGTSGTGTIWQIRGILPSQVGRKNQCGKSEAEYVAFIDVAKYSKWIKEVINQNG